MSQYTKVHPLKQGIGCQFEVSKYFPCAYHHNISFCLTVLSGCNCNGPGGAGAGQGGGSSAAHSGSSGAVQSGGNPQPVMKFVYVSLTPQLLFIFCPNSCTLLHYCYHNRECLKCNGVVNYK